MLLNIGAEKIDAKRKEILAGAGLIGGLEAAEDLFE